MSQTKLTKEYGQLCGDFERIARAMSCHYDINVIPGTRCCTDGRTIEYPFNADYIKTTSKQILHGLLDHEEGHVSEEDEHIEAGKRTPLTILREDCKTNISKSTMNIFEDKRMEHQRAQKYVGVAENLCATRRWAIDRLNKKIELAVEGEEKKTGWWKISSALMLELSGDEDKVPESVKPILDVVRDEIEQAKDPKIMRWAEDAHRISEAIIKKLQEMDLEDDLEDDSKGGSGDESRGELKKGSEDEMREETRAIIRELKDGEDIDEEDYIDDLKKEIEKEAREELETTKRYTVAPVVKKMDEIIIPQSNKRSYRRAKKDVEMQIKGIKRRLYNLMRTKALDTYMGDREEGDIDCDTLATVPTGNRRIYRQEIEGDVVDTAWMLLIDLSGSMGSNDYGHTCSYYTQRMAIGLSEALDDLGIPFAVWGFYNPYDYHDHEVSRLVTHEMKYNSSMRTERLQILAFKNFNEKYRKVCARFGSITGYDNNTDGDAVLWAAKELALRPEKRKILSVLSDGEPAGGNVDYPILEKHLKEVVKMITKTGIEVLGVGANTRSVERFYNASTGAKNVVIKDLSTLAVKMYKIFRTMLLEERRRGAA